VGFPLAVFYAFFLGGTPVYDWACLSFLALGGA